MIKEYKDYYNNGQIYEHSFFKDGYFHGECKWYYKNGRLRRHFFYNDGKKHGECKIYNEDGQIYKHEIWVDSTPLDINPATISNEDKLALKLKYNIEFLPE